MSCATESRSPARARALALAIGVAIALLVGRVGAATARRVDAFELCASCGASRVTHRVLDIGVQSRVEPRGWLGSLVEPEHRHGFVANFTTGKGWMGTSIACSRPAAAYRVLALEGAHEQLGDDPELVALGRRFVRTSAEAETERAQIAEAARALVGK